LAAAGLVGAAVAVGLVFDAWLQAPGRALLFTLAVLVAALRQGLPAGIAAAVGAFLAENFFFVEPTFTFSVARPSDWSTLLVQLAAGATTGFLVGRLREEADAAEARAQALYALNRCAAELVAAPDERAVAEVVIGALALLKPGATVALASRAGRLEPIAPMPPPVLSPEDLALAERAHRRGRAEQGAAEGRTESRFSFAPLGRDYGVLGYVEGADVRAEFRQACDAMIGQAGLALDRLAAARDAAAAEAAAEREAMRAALLSSLSHDLRTPLATILGGITSLRQLSDAMSAAAREDTLSAIEAEAERLSRYVGGLLNLTRLKAGVQPRLEWTDPADVARAAAARARRSAPGRSIVVTAGAAPPFRSDAVLLEQALFNLIENALKFSPAAEPVEVGVESDAARLAFTVGDRGPGIPADERERVFEPFYRGRGMAEGGAGLGLAIVGGIAIALGGAVSAAGREGGGALLRLSLPVDGAPA
jgi:two-component system sensor histidine kinase KdpD